ncbi:TRAP transporter small permease [Halodesulfovibrio aestuarii]|uniref:TRAP transporter small permease n=1 Tax=Halodesulfovibrio aestuarii TaxID=126333 RepID=A0ABV4JRY8_9BACT
MTSMATICQTISNKLERLCLFGAGALLLINLATVILGVFSRFYRPPIWTTDLAKITLVWMVMLAAAPALKHGEHMAITILVNRLPPSSKRIVTLLRTLCFFCILLLMIWLGFNYAYKLRLFTIMTLGIKKSLPLLAVPVGMSLMLLEYLLQQFIPAEDDKLSVSTNVAEPLSTTSNSTQSSQNMSSSVTAPFRPTPNDQPSEDT